MASFHKPVVEAKRAGGAIILFLLDIPNII